MGVSRTIYIGPYLQITAPHDNFDPNVVCGTDTFVGPWINEPVNKGDILRLLPNQKEGGGVNLPDHGNFFQRLDEDCGDISEQIDIFGEFYRDQMNRLEDYLELDYFLPIEFGIFQWEW